MEKRGGYHTAGGRDFHRIRVRSYMSMFHVASRPSNLTDWTTTLLQLKGEGEALAAAHGVHYELIKHKRVRQRHING